MTRATVRVDGASGGTLTVVGSNGDDTPRFEYYDYASGTDYTRIFDSDSVQIAASAPECRHPDVDLPDPADIPQASEDVALCEDGGDKPFLTQLVLTLFAETTTPTSANASTRSTSTWAREPATARPRLPAARAACSTPRAAAARTPSRSTA